MAECCTCTPHFRTEHLPQGGTRQVFACSIFMPGCPVHELPDEDDRYAFETPPSPPQVPVTRYA